MTRWEYDTVECEGHHFDRGHHREAMNLLGKMGWEAYAVSVQHTTHYIHLRRPLSRLTTPADAVTGG